MGLAPIQELLDLSLDKIWRPCLICSGEVNQIRKAFFKCGNCGLKYITEETEMMIKFFEYNISTFLKELIRIALWG